MKKKRIIIADDHEIFAEGLKRLIEPKYEVVAVAQDRMIIGKHENVSAAELAFPESQRSLCFEFMPSQDVNFTEAGMEFTVNSYAGDKWSIGFCPNGQLQDWRWGK